VIIINYIFKPNLPVILQSMSLMQLRALADEWIELNLMRILFL